MNKDWLDIDVLEDYLDGKLDAKAMHFVERQALDDPFVAEALEGLRLSPKRKENISILQKQLYHRIANQPVKRKTWGITTQRLSIAATATVAFIAVSILFFMRETNRKNAEIAQRKASGVVVSLDSNQAIAATQLTKQDTQTIDSETKKSAFIDDAINSIKTADLAKNVKPVPEIKTEESRFSENKPTVDYNSNVAEVKAKNETFAARKMAAPASPAVLTEPSISGGGLIYSGNVVTQKDGAPVQGAMVKLAGSKNTTTTDNQGNFYLPLDSNLKSKDILVKASGYEEEAVAMDPNTIRMALSGNKTLNEIALITKSNGYKRESIPLPKIVLRPIENLDKKSTVEVTKPIPVSTINYEQYLESNNKLFNPKGPEQFVILSFTVKKNGRPTGIKIVKSLNNDADAEAKRLVENGPDWVLPKKGTDRVELSIKF